MNGPKLSARRCDNCGTGVGVDDSGLCPGCRNCPVTPAEGWRFLEHVARLRRKYGLPIDFENYDRFIKDSRP